MTKKVIFSICTAMIVVFSFGFFKVNFLDRKESKLTVTNVDLQENCIYAIAKNQLYDADDEYIIHGASDYLKGQVQLSQIKEGENNYRDFKWKSFTIQIHTNLIRYIAFGHNDCASEKYTNDSYVRRQMPP